MEAGAVAAAGVILNGIVNAADRILQLGDRWYKADSAWKELPRQVELLKEKNTQWTKLVMQHGLRRDEALMNTLGEARHLLEVELEKLQLRQEHCGKGWKTILSMLHKAMFPSLIGLSINKAIQAFDDVPQKLKTDYKNQMAAGKRTFFCERMLSFSKHDHRYVRLEKTELELKTALLDPNGHKVIVLHGGPGKGKSTLARYLALQIQPYTRTDVKDQKKDDIKPASNDIESVVQSTRNQRDARSNWAIIPHVFGQVTDMRADGQTSPLNAPNLSHEFSAVQSQSAVSPVLVHGRDMIQSDEAVSSPHLVQTGSTQLSEMFDEVVFLECSAPSAGVIEEREPNIVQRALWKKLGGWMQDDGRVEPSEMRTSLQCLLRERKVLIILDNVWEPTFLGNMVYLTDGAQNVKLLVTSQNEKLCHRLNFYPALIRMETASLRDARKMFARHIRRSEDVQEIDTIPEQVQGLADELTDKVDANLLAIACLATGIDPKRIGDVEEWKKLRRDYFRLLNSKGTAMIFNVEYPGSYWTAIQFSFERLEEGAKRLLILIGLCEANAVPQEVLEHFYGKISQRMDFPAFKIAKLELEAKDLVQVRDYDYYIHDLLRKFVNDHESIRELRKVVLTALAITAISEIADPDREDVLSIVIFLYLRRSLIAEQIDFEVRIAMDCETRRRKRYELEPVIRLLVEDDIEDGTVHSCKHLRQVFLKYIEEDSVDEEILRMLSREADFKAKVSIVGFLLRSQLIRSNSNLSSLLWRRTRRSHFVRLIRTEWWRL